MNIIKRNVPFALMMGASAALFLVNLFIKKYSNDEIYSYFALFIIYSGYASSLSLLASEQVALRYTEIRENNAYIEKEILYIILLSSVAAAFIFIVLAKLLFKEIDMYVIFLCLTTFISSSLTTIAYNYHRIQSNFNISQFTLNSWKYLLPILFGGYYLFSDNTNKQIVSSIITIALLFSVIFSIYTIYSHRTNIIIKESTTPSWRKLLKSQLGFIASLSFLSMANTLDKVYIENFLSTKEFSDYFFTTLVLMYPTLALSNYIGFKEFTKIKNGANYNLDRILIKLAITGLLIFVINACIIYVFRSAIPTLWNPGIIILLMTLSSVRLPYSFLSAVMGAKASAPQMLNSNIICWALGLTLIGVFMLLEKTLLNALLCVLCIWIIRDATYYCYAKSNTNTGILKHDK